MQILMTFLALTFLSFNSFAEHNHHHDWGNDKQAFRYTQNALKNITKAKEKLNDIQYESFRLIKIFL